jgi:hypothetical protein
MRKPSVVESVLEGIPKVNHGGLLSPGSAK